MCPLVPSAKQMGREGKVKGKQGLIGSWNPCPRTLHGIEPGYWSCVCVCSSRREHTAAQRRGRLCPGLPNLWHATSRLLNKKTTAPPPGQPVRTHIHRHNLPACLPPKLTLQQQSASSVTFFLIILWNFNSYHLTPPALLFSAPHFFFLLVLLLLPSQSVPVQSGQQVWKSPWYGR